MSINILVLVLICLSACSHLDFQQSVKRLQTDISDRASVNVNWESGAEGNQTVNQYIANKLAKTLTIDDAVAISLLKNPRLVAMYHELGLAGSDLVAAGLPNNPAFSGERRFGGKAEEFDISQDFLSLFLIPLRRQLGKSEFERARLRLTHEILLHTADVRTAYYHAQAAEQAVELFRTVMKAMDAGVVAAKALRNAGNNAIIDFAISQQSSNLSRLELADAELDVMAAREKLNVLLGLWGEETNWTVPHRLQDIPMHNFDLHQLEVQAILERLDLASLRAEIEALAQSQGITRITSVLPEFSITMHSEREPEGETTRGPSLMLPLSIFNRGEAARSRARFMLAQAEDRYAALAVEIRSQVRLAFARMETAKRKAIFYRDTVLPTQQVISEQTLLRYNGMFVGVFDLLKARREQVDSGREYIQTLEEYWAARTELERALGRRIPVAVIPQPSSVEEQKDRQQ
jgi:outer membrane protein, heavy metal efflux system